MSRQNLEPEPNIKNYLVRARIKSSLFLPGAPGSLASLALSANGITSWGGGAFKSTNSGESWSPINTGLTSSSVGALAIDPLTPTTLYAGTEGGGVFSMKKGIKTYLPLVLRGG